jgi:hypothetical protein
MSFSFSELLRPDSNDGITGTHAMGKSLTDAPPKWASGNSAAYRRRSSSSVMDRALKKEQPASFSACGLPGGLFGID